MLSRLCGMAGKMVPYMVLFFFFMFLNITPFPEPQHFTTTVTRSSPTVPFVEFSSSAQLKNDAPEEKDQKKVEDEMSGKVELVLSQKVKYVVV